MNPSTTNPPPCSPLNPIPRPPVTWDLTRFIFIRLLALVYAIAFASLWVQLDGLIGSNGILPAHDYMERIHAYAQANDASPFAIAPTLCLWFHTDAALHALCGAGIVLAILLALGVLPPLMLLLLWLNYLSLSIAGQTFLGFQWENLLLETGLLAIFFAPATTGWHPGPTLPPTTPAARWIWRGLVTIPRTLARGLLCWLLFRLMLQSGLIKLASHDDVWWNLTALTYHYWTQPLPTWTSYYANLLPLWFQKLSVAITYAIEILFPFFIAGPRLLRRIAFTGFSLLMALIALTGNYTYFNLLTVALAVVLLDDACWPRRLRNWWSARARPNPLAQLSPARLRMLAIPAAALTLLVAALTTEILPPSWLYLHTTLHRFSTVAAQRLNLPLTIPAPTPTPAQQARLARWAPCRSVNSYGLFANMTESRPEIILEGSVDGHSWTPYEFRYKPGNPHRRPRFVQPHQPRLDWQMWFAALSTARDNPWLIRLMEHLLHATPPVLDLLGPNPFPDAPPRYLRASIRNYRFTTLAEKKATGAWWIATTPPAPYTPILTLVDGQLAVATP